MMIRKTRLIPQLLLTLGLGASLSLSSCSDNEIAGGGGNNGNNDSDSTLVNQIDKRDALTRLLGALADVDSLPDAWSTYTVEPTVGVVKDAAEPHVRYLVVPNAAEAYRTYCSYVGAGFSDEAKNDEWKVDSIGSLRFEVNNQADLYATLKVNVQQLPTLEELRFVPSTAIGDNGIKPAGMYYRFGDVIKQTKDDKVSYYVCVRPCSKEQDLRKTHWATLQVYDDNFKELGDRLTLPTKLCAKQDEGARMVQNYFNVLRIAHEASNYNLDKGLDKITKNEFPEKEAIAMHNLWEMENTWDELPYGFEIEDNNQGTILRNLIKEAQQLNAFYHGYSSVWWPGKGDYRVYQLRLTSSVGSNLYDKAEASTPWLKKRTSDNFSTDFKAFRDIPNAKNVYIDFYDENNYQNHFVVKTQTGAELLGQSGVDPAPEKSFVGQKPKGNITIEDIITQHDDVAYPFYTLGDKVTNSTEFSGEQMCFLSSYTTGDYGEDVVSYFICNDQGDVALNPVTDINLAKRILCQFYIAHCYANYNQTFPLSYTMGSREIPLTDAEQKAYYNMLTELYNKYLKGKIKEEVRGDGFRIIANLGGEYWAYTQTDESSSVGQVEKPSSLKPLRIVRYQDNSSGQENFSDAKKGSITFNLRGVKARIHLKKAWGEFLTSKCGEW